MTLSDFRMPEIIRTKDDVKDYIALVLEEDSIDELLHALQVIEVSHYAKSLQQPCVTPLQDVLAYTQREYNDLCGLINSEIFQYMPKAQQSLILRRRYLRDHMAGLTVDLPDAPV